MNTKYIFFRWATDHHDELLAKDSALEFKLHRLKFIDLLHKEKHREALQYSRIFPKFDGHIKGKPTINISLVTPLC